MRLLTTTRAGNAATILALLITMENIYKHIDTHYREPLVPVMQHRAVASNAIRHDTLLQRLRLVASAVQLTLKNRRAISLLYL